MKSSCSAGPALRLLPGLQTGLKMLVIVGDSDWLFMATNINQHTLTLLPDRPGQKMDIEFF